MKVVFTSETFTKADFDNIKMILLLLEKDTKAIDDKAAEKDIVLKDQKTIFEEIKTKAESKLPKPDEKK